MAARNTILMGPAGSGKTGLLIARYRAALSSGVPGSVLWLAPTGRSAALVRQRLLALEMPACFAPGVTTFDRFAESVLQSSPTLVKPISDHLQQQLTRRLIDEAVSAGRLQYFRSIADTPGFVDLVCRFIREWKRMEIWPEQFREVCRQQGETAKDAELAGLYAEYQQQLIDHNLYDAEGRFWTARRLLREGRPRPLEHLELVVVDGFADFTRTQHEILQILSQRTAEMFISLPGESGEERNDLFAKPRKTLQRLRDGQPDLIEREVSRRSESTWSAMAHLEQRLFQNPREVSPAADAAGVEIVAATGQYEEIVRIGGRIKALLTRGDPSSLLKTSGATAGLPSSGTHFSDESLFQRATRQGSRPVPPADIMVVFRSFSSVAPLVREVFSEQGIPFTLDSGQPLGRSPALASLMLLLSLDAEDWPLARLLAVLTNNYFRPEWPQWRDGAAAAAANSVIRRLQFFSGRRTLFEALERRIEFFESKTETSTDDPDSDRRATPSEVADQCRLAIDLLRRLSEAYDALGQRATAGQWVEQLRRFATDVGFVAALDDAPKDDLAIAPDVFDDRAAWRRLTEALTAPDDVARLTGSEPPTLDRADFLHLLSDTLRSVQLPPSTDETGRVRVLSAASARALSVPYLFIAGLSEKSFPPPDREDRAYSEAEYRRLAAAGLPLVLREERGHEEMLLFYEVATRATRQLTLSYPALDEKAEPLLPSPFVTDVERLFECYQSPRPLDTTRLSPVPREDEMFSARSHRLRAVDEALRGNVGLLSRLTHTAGTRQVGRGILAGLTAIHGRSQKDGFGAYEGMLQSDAARRRLVQRFGADHAWSPSTLERYMNCPYRFLLADVLRLQEPPEAEFEIDRRRRGSMLHRLLAALHRQLKDQGQSPADLDDETYQARCGELLSQFSSARSGEGPLAAALTELDRRQLWKWIEQYRRQAEEYGAVAGGFQQPPTPSHFEVAFGLSDQIRHSGEDRDPLSTSQPLRLSLSERTVLISGMIDRIDLARRQDQAVFNVVDYKTGATPSHKAVRSGQALQLSLYAMAAETLLLADDRATPWQIGYWELKERGFRASMDLAADTAAGVSTSDDWQELRTQLTGKVHSLIHGIHSAEFPVFSNDKHCTGNCPYNTVCRIGQVRALEKTWQPPESN